jgi:choline-sulfatase
LSWIVLVWLGCSDPPVAAPAPTPETAPKQPDVYLIVLDTLRADALTPYGSRDPSSVELGAFVRHATRFDAAYAPSSWTVPSTASLHTGQHPLRHGLRHAGDVMPAGHTLLSERLQAAGWRTGAWSHNVNVSKKNGYDQGFDSFHTFGGKVLAYPDAEEMIGEIQGWAAGSGPNFVYMQPMNCHGPYRVPEGRRDVVYRRPPIRGFHYGQGPMRAVLSGALDARAKVDDAYVQSLREQYTTAVRYTVAEVARLLAWLVEQRRYDDALLVFTADHGEELFEHGGFSHGYSLHEEVLRVPLFVKLPGQRRPGVVKEPVSLEDIVPTVLDVVGEPVPEGDGRSLVPLLRGEGTAPRALVADIDWKGRMVGRSVLEDGWRLVAIASNYEGLTDTVRLYEHATDPKEAMDRAATEPGRVAAMTTRLSELTRGYTAATVENVLSEMDRAQLEALGYAE